MKEDHDNFLDRIKNTTFKSRINQRTIMNSSEFARKFLSGHPELVEQLINEILDIPFINIKEAQGEFKEGDSEHKRSVFDIIATDNKSVLIDLEFQKANEHDVVERSIEYQSQLIIAELPPGWESKTLPKVIIIFFTDFDASGMNIPFFKLSPFLTDLLRNKIYNLENLNQKIFGREPARYFFNVNELRKKKYENTPKGKWAQDLTESEPEKIHNELFKKRMHFLKKTEKGEAIMLEIDRRIREEGRLEGLAEGWKEKEIEQKNNFISTINFLRQQNFKDEAILEYAKALGIDISLEEIRKK